MIVASRGDFSQSLTILEGVRSRTLAQRPLGDGDAGLLNQLGVLYRKLGRFGEAEPLLKQALAARERVYGAGHMEAAIVMNNLGDLYSIQQRYKEAEKMLTESSGICKKLSGASPRCANIINNLASVEQHTGRLAEAESHYKEAVTLTSSQPGTISVHAAALNNLGRMYASQKRPKEAREMFDRALDAWERAQATNHPDYASTLSNLAALLMSQKKFSEAGDLFRKALAMDEKLLGPDHWKIGVDLNNLASLEAKQKHYPEAVALLRRSVAIEEKFEPDGSGLASASASLGEALALTKQYDEAAENYGRAARIWERRPTYAPPNHVALLTRYEQILRELHDYASAEQVAAQAMRLRVRSAIEKSMLPQ